MNMETVIADFPKLSGNENIKISSGENFKSHPKREGV